MDYMDEAAVDKAVFVQPWFYHWDNSYMIEGARRYPDRFRAVCVIDPRGPGAAAALKKWHTQGATGIRLRPYREGEGPTTGTWLGTEETMPLWEAIAETDTIVCVLWAGADLGRLRGLLKKFPSVRVVIDHLNTGTACPSWKHGWNRGAALVQLVHEERGVVPHEDPRSACSMGLVWHRERLA